MGGDLREEPVLLPRSISGCAGWLDVTITLLAHIEGPQISSSPVWKRAGVSARQTESLHGLAARDAVTWAGT